MTLPAERSPQIANPFVSLAARIVELRERVEDAAWIPASEQTHQSATQFVVDAFEILAQFRESAVQQSDLQRAESVATRELTAAKRHLELAKRSPETRSAACDLAVRALTRAVDSLLNALVPHTIPPG
ncbi:MAG TPA: hypothetical protein VFQ61_26300 [Polyangiaceae bacterium]|nr:hypothetical protein [Polyangiaceae bacterium]